MNKNRRKALAEINDRLGEILNDLEELLAEEEEVRDNIPENLQGSERYEKCENACYELDEAIASINEAMSSIDIAQE